MISDDMALVREYVQSNSEQAFSTLVSRHVNLVYSVALRQVRQPHLAEEITQSVFIILARKAKSLSPKTILSGWLCRTARNLSADTMKIQRRRQIREQETQMQSKLNEPEPGVWNQIAPLLDEALNSLGEKEHDAVVLRFFDGKELKQVGSTMGTTEDAARMRVNRGIEKLRGFFSKRGVTLSATAIAGAVAANSVQAAPVGLAATITAAAFSGTTITTAAVIAATKSIAMTTLQKTAIFTALAVAVGTGIYEARQATNARAETRTLQQQQMPLAEQIQQVLRERDELAKKLDALRSDNEQLNRNTAELLRLRREVGRLRSEARLSQQANPVDSSTDTAAKHWLARVNQLRTYVEKNPSEQIPEFQFMTDREWLTVADAGLDTELFEKSDDYRRAMESLRSQAESRFSNLVQGALNKYALANNGQFPTQFSVLNPFCEPAVVEMLEQLYEIKPVDILPANVVKDFNVKVEWVVTRKQRVNSNSTSRLATFIYGSAYWQSPP